MYWLNYHHLYYFRIIALEGSISKASIKLRLGQPTLSTQLKQFEETIGHSLFERKNKRLYLNESGKKVLEYANEIFRLGEEMIQVLEDHTSINEVPLVIGALDSVPKNIVGKLVEFALTKKHCSIEVREDKGEQLFHELHQHKLDLVLTNYPPPINAHSESKTIFKKIAFSDIIICGTEKFKHLRKNFPDSLNQSPFIMPTTHSQLRHDIDNFFHNNQIEVKTVANAQDTTLMSCLCLAGLGLIAISRLEAKEFLDDKRMITIGSIPNLQEDIWLSSSQRKIENPLAKIIMNQFEIFSSIENASHH
jgi:LysR family transcriptional activator of nhaA